MNEKKKVLFICTHNSARSHMAEGLLRANYPDHYEAYSAGTEPSGINPHAIKEDLASLSRINRAIMQIMNLCLTFVFFAFAYISLFHATELLTTSLGKTLLVLISVFWRLRAIEQIIFFSLRKKISVALLIVFVFGALIYLFPVLAG